VEEMLRRSALEAMPKPSSSPGSDAATATGTGTFVTREPPARSSHQSSAISSAAAVAKPRTDRKPVARGKAPPLRMLAPAEAAKIVERREQLLQAHAARAPAPAVEQKWPSAPAAGSNAAAVAARAVVFSGGFLAGAGGSRLDSGLNVAGLHRQERSPAAEAEVEAGDGKQEVKGAHGHDRDDDDDDEDARGCGRAGEDEDEEEDDDDYRYDYSFRMRAPPD
jgi:hypothetical protein